MRKLSKKQIAALDELVEQGCINIYDIPMGEYNNIYAMNEYETFWQDANRYLWDEYFRIINAV